jgi:nitroreductase
VTESTLPLHIERILDAAHLAPSRDNLQPWRFAVEGSEISFLVDHERDRSAANAGARMARIAVGNAVECALLRIGRMGVTVRMVPPRGNALATLSVSEPKRYVEPDKAFVRRITNRHVYDARPIDDATFSWLREATPVFEGVRTVWFGRERARTLGPIFEEAESLYYGDARLRQGALGAVRFDVRDREEVAQGLSVGSLELSGPDRVTFDSLRKTPPERLAAMGAFKKMGARARRLVESASGVCVLVAPSASDAHDVAVGRSMYRAWLALTRRGLAAQPMTSVSALEAATEVAGAASFGEEAARVTAAISAFHGAFPSVERGARIAIVMRYGWAPAPTSRVRRLPVEDSLASGLSVPVPAMREPATLVDAPEAATVAKD